MVQNTIDSEIRNKEKKVINPDIRNFVNVTAHPAGCEKNVNAQIEYAQQVCPGKGIGNVLVIGSSAGYGLAGLITTVFGYGANALGVCFERPREQRRSATPGYYNVAALHKMARQQGKHVETLNGDAFSHAIRTRVIGILKERYGKLDYIIYSLASSRRQDPDRDYLYRSCLKPIGTPCRTKNIDLKTGEVIFTTIPPAEPLEIRETIKVMGGEDWLLWLSALADAGLLQESCRTLAYTYVGSESTAPIYRTGTMGEAKKNLEQTSCKLDHLLKQLCDGSSWVCSCQAQVTRASSVIPGMALYLSLLKKVTQQIPGYESAIQQLTRLFKSHLAPGLKPRTDNQGLIRLDEWELLPAVQQLLLKNRDRVTTENLKSLADYPGFKEDFLSSAGFAIPGIDYGTAVEPDVDW